ncbi:N-acetylmuramic acid 6-phosphate etherase [Candidatus Levibacter sp. Uisw_134_01]|jgi:N-acetylmuramic acid 6-phosphate etherase|uniref:N-acetylmuramic acid 6-phosphate etherase n=1 Tax=Candidatus Levibacter sp. Uisw_134_01 TaxID=3230999 RepID=UPI003D426465
MFKNIPKTELLYHKSKPIDRLSLSHGLSLMIKEQKDAALEVKRSIKSIEHAIDAIYKQLTLGSTGRLIYAGAGTSARIGVQDGVELFPTFNWPTERLDFIIAGGFNALLKAVENAEDDTYSAEKNVEDKLVCHEDVVIGVAASGNTPFTCKVLEKAKDRNALTIAISNNPYGKILKYGDHKIILNTKAEVIAGSTRLKAGTAQKICLNVISSMVMVKMGRVKNGMMNEMVPTNEKLRLRKNKLINFIN